MIRGENAVTDIANLCPDSNGGDLTTLNITSGTVDQLNADLSVTPLTIPDWVAQQRTKDNKSLWWLCMKLEYKFVFNYTAHVRFFSPSTHICH